MNKLKRQLDKELQTIKLSAARQQSIIQQAKKPKKPTRNWQYKMVVASFVAVAFVFIITTFGRQGEEIYMTQLTASSQSSVVQLLQFQWLRAVLFFALLFVILQTMRMYQRKKYGVVQKVCANCGQTWSIRALQKIYWKNHRGQACEHCQHQQYITRSSRMRTGVYTTVFIPAIIFQGTFQLGWYGIILTILFLGYIIRFCITDPIELQNEDPNDEEIPPLW